jgi:hypothetical protein
MFPILWKTFLFRTYLPKAYLKAKDRSTGRPKADFVEIFVQNNSLIGRKIMGRSVVASFDLQYNKAKFRILGPIEVQ